MFRLYAILFAIFTVIMVLFIFITYSNSKYLELFLVLPKICFYQIVIFDKLFAISFGFTIIFS